MEAAASSDAINVVFSADRRFIPYFATSLASLLSNYAAARPLHVYLLTDPDFSAEDRDRVESLSKFHPFTLHVIHVDASKYSEIKTTVGISVAAYNRLFMDSLLPEELSRALYFDSDLIITQDIGAIYDLPMDGLLFRGAEDSISSVYKSRYDLPPESHHINSGVMLCNLTMMRALDFDAVITKFLAIHRYRIVMGDQQIINEVFHDKIGALPLAWNVHGMMFKSGWVTEKVGSDNTMDPEEALRAIANPAVIHYTFKRKPWTSLEHPRSRTWHRYNEKTPFRVGLPKGERPTRESDKDNKKNASLAAQFERTMKRFKGYWRSIETLRTTRLEVMDIRARVGGISRFVATPAQEETTTNEKSREALLHLILSELGRERAQQPFVARDFVSALPEGSSILCNALQRDLDGGFNENIKTVLRTSNISRHNLSDAEFALILTHRVHTTEFWQCINAAKFYGIPLIFVEMSFFTAFSGYFDKSSRPAERRCIGFYVDDMGSYFDSRQPSRTEVTLNDPNYVLSASETDRAARVIDLIVRRRVTKYNKYVPLSAPAATDIEEGAIVVFDQKRGDASIDFARSDNRSFQRMLAAAVAENPDRTIYFKAHPDNIHRGVQSSELSHSRVRLIADEMSSPDLLDRASKVYVVSSQVGFEALLRRKEVVVFGQPFYAGWGLTDDRCSVKRRRVRRSIEDVFHVTCIRQSVYIDPTTARLIELEDALDLIQDMRLRFIAPEPARALEAEVDAGTVVAPEQATA